MSQENDTKDPERKDPGADEPRHLRKTWIRPAMLILAAALAGGSYFFTMWQLTLHAPQYPNGLTAKIVGTGLSGDIAEINTLNHYIGMMPLEDLGHPEFGLWGWGILLLVAVFLLAAILRGWKRSVLAVAGATYPIIFAVDLYRWLHYSGHHLDPTAAMSGSIEPFMPAFVGSKMVAQFKTTAAFGPGFWMACAASVIAVAAAIWEWRSRKRP